VVFPAKENKQKLNAGILHFVQDDNSETIRDDNSEIIQDDN